MKFGGYKIYFKKISVREKSDTQQIVVKAQLSGNIEIGIDIDMFSWRQDEFTRAVFKKDAQQYELIHVYNCYTQYSPVEVNVVTAIYRRRNI